MPNEPATCDVEGCQGRPRHEVMCPWGDGHYERKVCDDHWEEMEDNPRVERTGDYELHGDLSKHR